MGRAFLPDFARLFASSPLKAPILAAFRQRRMFPGRLFLQVDGLPKGDAFQLDSRRLQTVEASFKDRLLHFTVKDPDPVALAKPFLTLFIPGIPLERAAALERGSVPLGRALDFRTLGVEGTPAMIWCSSKHWRTGEITFDTIEYDEEGALTALAARFELLEEPSGGRISGAVAYVSEAPPAR